MRWFDKLLGKTRPPLTSGDIWKNSPNEVPVADYPKTHYSAYWEKLIGETPNRVTCALRFYSRETGELLSETQLADPTLEGVTKLANKLIRERMEAWRK